MSSSVNKAILIGHLGHDPEIRTFPDGGRVANLSLATSETWKDKATGEKKERTQWHRIVVSNDGLIGICEKYLVKGSKVYVEGQIETRKYTGRDGVEKYTTEITLRPYRGTILMLDTRGRRESVPDSDEFAHQNDPHTGPSAAAGSVLADDEIPF